MKGFLILALFTWEGVILSGFGQGLQAGASAVDVTPIEFPVIQNGGFLEGQIQLATEKLHARCLALADGETRLAIVIVDSCMIPRTLCDKAKALAAKSTGLAEDRILIAATHTHSAPSVMNFCLGSRADPNYTPFLLSKIVESIEQAVSRLEPAQAAWAAADAGDYTNCRRWITRADAMQADPFGERTVRAMMHPGYQNPEFVGPSGPKDPWLSFLSVQTATGEPLALLGNFSMHYFGGHPGASPDYCGQFARQIAKRLAPRDNAFVGILSQGTSGDLWWADYSQPKIHREIGGYTASLVDLVIAAYEKSEHRSDVRLAMAESRMTLRRRLPDAERLAWAREKLQSMEGGRPRNRPEVYAEQAVYIHENPTEEIVLQAIRVGELGITTMPNEVYGLTGLKLKARSPLATTFNVSLANGAAGYIPPPEQHALGGYNAWPARTAGLETEAEPKIVEGVLSLLEQVAGRKRRSFTEPAGAYAKAVLAKNPMIYWRLGEMEGGEVMDRSGNGVHGTLVGSAAFHLAGVDGPGFGERYASRAVHLVDGRIDCLTATVGNRYTLMLWLWNGVTNDLHSVTGNIAAIGENWGICGDGEDAGRLFVSNGSQRLVGKTVLETRRWYQVALVRDGDRVRAFLDGESELAGEMREKRSGKAFSIGGFQGKLDEVSIFGEALAGSMIGTLYKAAFPSGD